METKYEIIGILTNLIEEQQEELDNLKRRLQYIEDDVKYPIFTDDDVDETACKCGKCHNYSDDNDDDELENILFSVACDNLSETDDDVTLSVHNLDDNTSAIVDELITLNEILEKIYKRM